MRRVRSFPTVEKWMLGLMTDDELLATNEYLTYCPITSVQASTTYDQDNNIITASCIAFTSDVPPGLKFFSSIPSPRLEP